MALAWPCDHVNLSETSLEIKLWLGVACALTMCSWPFGSGGKRRTAGVVAVASRSTIAWMKLADDTAGGAALLTTLPEATPRRRWIRQPQPAAAGGAPRLRRSTGSTELRIQLAVQRTVLGGVLYSSGSLQCPAEQPGSGLRSSDSPAIPIGSWSLQRSSLAFALNMVLHYTEVVT